jgi:hypothetical protein
MGKYEETKNDTSKKLNFETSINLADRIIEHNNNPFNSDRAVKRNSNANVNPQLLCPPTHSQNKH